MGSVKKFVHSENLEFVKLQTNETGVDWIRKCRVEIAPVILKEESDYPGGLIEIVKTLTGLEKAGLPPFIGMGLKVIDAEVPEGENLRGDLYYYSTLEVGSRLCSIELSGDKFHEDERVLPVPSWIPLEPPTEEEEEETQEED